ncbi:aminopeptidase P family protein [Burkholderiaceae bacterium DAT-1]|nr:aminopeptidase P family protein [Burkholderiaceae bacterium DAT-1]
MTAISSPVPARLERLRAAMHEAGVHAVLVPSSDPHLSEYLPERFKSREYFSGFTGSMGTLVVTLDFAGVWADGRYWVQGEAELAGTGVQLMKIPSAASAMHLDWVAANLKSGQTIAVHGDMLALAGERALRAVLAGTGVTLRTDLDVPGAAWADRPSLPEPPVYEHLAPYATQTRADRLAAVRSAMRESGATQHFVSTLDDLCWIFNLRGSDVNFNPVFLAHALIDLNGATLFVGAGKVSPDLAARLTADNVHVRDYAEAKAALGALAATEIILIDPRRITFGFREAIPAEVPIVEAINPSTFAKSRKSAAEVAHVRSAMEQDGAALAEFFSWLEGAFASGDTITELTIDEQITAARARRPGFTCPSFATIAGFNANGALPHYRATEASHAVIRGDGLLLIDSGGQYHGGTTDITRVVPVGTPSAEQKRDFTLVLKGMMNLSRARFPVGTKGPMLDALARAPIWEAGVDYGHGTGHGVGYFLNVHEGPQTISPHAMPEAHTAMLAGMITSIEPGIYKPGRHGVRIENLVLTVEEPATEFGTFLRFEALTLCPIDTRCLDLTLMRGDEIAWLNDYHTTVRTRLAPHVSGAALAWLLRRTEAVVL